MASNKGEYLAHPPSACCFSGTIHTGTPRGATEDILGVPSYISRPTEANVANGHVVLYFPDVWGFSVNAQLVMDGFADAGFLAVGMDYFRGCVWPLSSSPNAPPPSAPVLA